jgi:hypothetical protein
MAWIDQLRLAERKNALDHWLRSGGPSDPQTSPEKLAAEFCEYVPKWRGDEHRKSLEMDIGMYQRAEARRLGATSAMPNTAPGDGVVQPTPAREPSADTNGLTVRVAQIAEYVFSKHPKDGAAPVKKETLRTRAKAEGPVPDMTFDEFNDAFQLVYDTRQARPPKAGWSLQERYRRRVEAIKKRNKL